VISRALASNWDCSPPHQESAEKPKDYRRLALHLGLHHVPGDLPQRGWRPRWLRLLRRRRSRPPPPQEVVGISPSPLRLLALPTLGLTRSRRARVLPRPHPGVGLKPHLAERARPLRSHPTHAASAGPRAAPLSARWPPRTRHGGQPASSSAVPITAPPTTAHWLAKPPRRRPAPPPPAMAVARQTATTWLDQWPALKVVAATRRVACACEGCGRRFTLQWWSTRDLRSWWRRTGTPLPCTSTV